MTPAQPQLQGPAVRARPRGGVLIVDAALIVVMLALLPQTLELSETARRFPLATIVVILGLTVLDLLIELVPAVRRVMRFVEDDFIPSTSESSEVSEILRDQEDADAAKAPAFRTFTPLTAMAALTVAGALMYYLGYLVATPVFLAAFFLWSRVPLKVAIGITAVMCALNYFAFYDYLGMR